MNSDSNFEKKLNKSQNKLSNKNAELENYYQHLMQRQEYLKITEKKQEISQKFLSIKDKKNQEYVLSQLKRFFLEARIKSHKLFKRTRIYAKLLITRPQAKNNDLGFPNQLDYKESLSYLYKVELSSFLISQERLTFPKLEAPLVSIILVLYNKAELTLKCLRSLIAVANNPKCSCEIIVVDNASQDKTRQLLDQISGIIRINNNENLHFLTAVNQASKVAKGNYLLLLNNDAQILPGSLSSAINTYCSDKNIGAVGGKIVLLDGTLQEAGSIIWRDGSCLGYGRGDNPFDYSYMFQRDVNYCSGAFLLTERNLFLEMGGFDEDYKPAYYEETDYCLRLWERGKRVVYEPNAVIMHFEFGSAQSTQAAIELQKAHQLVFTQKHSLQLANYHFPPSSDNILLARTHFNSSYRVLFIDDRVPHAFLGSGFPRSRDILNALVSLNHCVTFYPLTFPEESWQEIYQDIPKVVEVVINKGIWGIEEFLQSRAQFYDLIFVSRPHNMEILNPILERHPQWFEKTRIIYDAEAIYGLREVSQRKLQGKNVSQDEIELLVKAETKLATKANAIVTVSEEERKYFTNLGFPSVYTLGHTVDVEPTPKKFEERTGIVFVGAIHDINSPNADSVFWFVEKILPQLQEKLGKDLIFQVVGFNECQEIWDLQNDSLQVLGKVESLQEIYNEARIFVAPTRFAAGIPFKVHHAAAYGLPVVTTSILASQLGWVDRKEILVGDDAPTLADKCIEVYTNQKLWETLRNSALSKIKSECSREGFIQTVHQIINV